MDEAQLREVLGGEPARLIREKIADRLNSLTRQFVERSPFVVVASGRPDGGLDVSPRGDPAGFVRILDERTLLLPDQDRKSTRLNSSHMSISYAVFCLKKKK